MKRASQATQGDSRRGRSSRSGRQTWALTEIGRRFESFRAEHPPGARIPAELREATLVALREGVAQGELLRACGVSWGQVMAWQARRPSAPVEAPLAEPTASAEASMAEPAGVRVFSVVDEEAAGGEGATVSSPAPEIVLRLGAWSVSVRIEGPMAGSRGGTCSP